MFTMIKNQLLKIKNKNIFYLRYNIQHFSLFQGIGLFYFLFFTYQFKLFNKFNETLISDLTENFNIISYKFFFYFFLKNRKRNFFLYFLKKIKFLYISLLRINIFNNIKQFFISYIYLDFDIVYFEIFLFLNSKKYIYNTIFVDLSNIFTYFFTFNNFFLLTTIFNFFYKNSQNKIQFFKKSIYIFFLKNIQIFPYWILRSQNTLYGNCLLGQRIRSHHFFNRYLILDFFQLKTYNIKCLT